MILVGEESAVALRIVVGWVKYRQMKPYSAAIIQHCDASHYVWAPAGATRSAQFAGFLAKCE